MPRVPKATPTATPKAPFGTSFGTPSESATYPESHTERPLRLTFGEFHVSPKPTPRATLRKPSEHATCPECLSRETPSGSLPSTPRVPNAHAERTLREHCE